MKINGLVYILIGAVVIGYSKFVESQNPDANLVIFFWVGVAVIMFGVFRLVVNAILGTKDSQESKEMSKANLDKLNLNPALSKVKVSGSAEEERRRIQQQINANRNAPCPRCQNMIPVTSQFCPNCGVRLR